MIAEAFERLDRDDLVLGPTDDGGYYLIGMRTPTTGRPAPWDVLSGVRMSTGTVLDEIAGARRRASASRRACCRATFDIDEAVDLDRLIPLALAP